MALQSVLPLEPCLSAFCCSCFLIIFSIFSDKGLADTVFGLGLASDWYPSRFPASSQFFY
jgi:hypothetical protein